MAATHTTIEWPLSNTKSKILSKVADLLDQFSDRLVNIARATRQNTDAISVLQDQLSVKIGGLENLGKYISASLNTYCVERGVQLTITMDPHDYNQIFHFVNVGDKLVKIEQGKAAYYLEPKESSSLKVRQDNVGWELFNIPRVVSLNGGL